MEYMAHRPQNISVKNGNLTNLFFAFHKFIANTYIRIK